MRSFRPLSLVAAIAAALLTGPARATEQDRVVEGGPNRLLLTTGAATFAFGYVSAAYVGATSSSDTDRMLLLPFVGPWASFAARGSCATTEACEAEPTYKALLVADGIVQAAGAAQIALAFLFRELVPASDPRIKPGAAVSSLQISPVRTPGAGIGIGVAATF
jgi:hypothetical protein